MPREAGGQNITINFGYVIYEWPQKSPSHLSASLLLLSRLLPPLADVAVLEIVDEEVGRAHQRQEHVAVVNEESVLGVSI